MVSKVSWTHNQKSIDPIDHLHTFNLFSTASSQPRTTSQWSLTLSKFALQPPTLSPQKHYTVLRTPPLSPHSKFPPHGRRIQGRPSRWPQGPASSVEHPFLRRMDHESIRLFLQAYDAYYRKVSSRASLNSQHLENQLQHHWSSYAQSDASTVLMQTNSNLLWNVVWWKVALTWRKWQVMISANSLIKSPKSHRQPSPKSTSRR